MIKHYYCPSDKGFYLSLHLNLPHDVIEISEETHAFLLAELSQGQEIVVEDGELMTQAIQRMVTWDTIRTQRDFRLAQSDWTQYPDVKMSKEKATAWQEYRQALRDITVTFDDPSQVVWPVSPNGTSS